MKRFRGDRLRRLRLEKRYTHQDLAELLDINTRQISRYESEDESDRSSPNSEVLCRMTDVFNVSSDYLLGRSDDSAIQVDTQNLSEKERTVIIALRRGGVIEAIRVLVEPE